MSNKFKTILLTVAMTGFVFSSATAFAAPGGADDVFPGTTNPCEQLWLVNDPGNAYLPENEGGECIDVPAHLKKVKVLFNLDNAVIQEKPIRNDADELDVEFNAVGVRHMALLGKVMQYRIAKKGLDPNDVAIVGIFHGPAMTQSKWPFVNKPWTAGGMPPEVKKWVHKIFDLKNAGINIQLEVCGVTLKGMQKTMRDVIRTPAWKFMDEKAIYSHVHDAADTEAGLTNATGRIYVNQGAIARIIDLQKDDFAYIQEE